MNPNKFARCALITLACFFILGLCVLFGSAAPAPGPSKEATPPEAVERPTIDFPYLTASYPQCEPKTPCASTDAPTAVLEYTNETKFADTSKRESTNKDDTTLLAQLTYIEFSGKSDTEAAQVMWCVLNRVDANSSTVAAEITAPGQFAYDAGSPVTDRLLALAEDVLARWQDEGAGRVLPEGYTQFRGDGQHNHYYRTFEDAQRGVNEYNGSLGTPYDT